MKIKNIISAVASLQKIASAELSMKTLYSVSKLMKKVETELDFYNMERQKIAEKYGTRIDDETFRISDDKKKDYEREMSELLDIEIEEDIKPITLPFNENVKLSYNDLIALEGFVDVQFEE